MYIRYVISQSTIKGTQEKGTHFKPVFWVLVDIKGNTYETCFLAFSGHEMGNILKLFDGC